MFPGMRELARQAVQQPDLEEPCQIRKHSLTVNMHTLRLVRDSLCVPVKC